MKIIHQVQTEDGDTIASIISQMGAYLGKTFDKNTLWDFNRNHMPSPGAMPAVGTVLRFPHDPADESGAPGLDELKNPTLSDAQVEGGSKTLGGDRTSDETAHVGPDGQPVKTDGSIGDTGFTVAPGGAPAPSAQANPGQDGAGSGALAGAAGEDEGFST